MSDSWYQDVLDFHRKFGCFIGTTPKIPDLKLQYLREDLIDEEVNETQAAIAERDLVKLADGIADSIYVLLGTAITYGIDIRPVWDTRIELTAVSNWNRAAALRQNTTFDEGLNTHDNH